METFRSCNVCGHSPPVFLYRKDGYSIVRCPGCSLVYVGDRLEGIDFHRLYDSSYYRSDDSRLYADYFGEEKERRKSARRNLVPLRLIVPEGRLLDVGCAAGFFLAEARRFYDVFGVEFSPVSSTYARDFLGLNVFTGTLEGAKFPEGFFHVVTLWDVIEHVQDPATLLGEVFRVLQPGGCAVITTGNVESPYARRSGPAWPLMTPPWHLYFFSRKTLACLARSKGFRRVFPFTRGTVSSRPLLGKRPVRILANIFQLGDIVQVFLWK